MLEFFSSIAAIGTLLTFPLFIKWIYKADIAPKPGQFIMIKEPRNLFEQYKDLEAQKYAIVCPLRKFIMAFVIVFWQSSPRL